MQIVRQVKWKPNTSQSTNQPTKDNSLEKVHFSRISPLAVMTSPAQTKDTAHIYEAGRAYCTIYLENTDQGKVGPLPLQYANLYVDCKNANKTFIYSQSSCSNRTKAVRQRFLLQQIQKKTLVHTHTLSFSLLSEESQRSVLKQIKTENMLYLYKQQKEVKGKKGQCIARFHQHHYLNLGTVL